MDSVSSGIYTCPLCSRRSQGAHACPPLNNLERWALRHMRRAHMIRTRS